MARDEAAGANVYTPDYQNLEGALNVARGAVARAAEVVARDAVGTETGSAAGALLWCAWLGDTLVVSNPDSVLAEANKQWRILQDLRPGVPVVRYMYDPRANFPDALDSVKNVRGGILAESPTITVEKAAAGQTPVSRTFVTFTFEDREPVRERWFSSHQVIGVTAVSNVAGRCLESNPVDVAKWQERSEMAAEMVARFRELDIFLPMELTVVPDLQERRKQVVAAIPEDISKIDCATWLADLAALRRVCGPTIFADVSRKLLPHEDGSMHVLAAIAKVLNPGYDRLGVTRQAQALAVALEEVRWDERETVAPPTRLMPTLQPGAVDNR